MQKCYGYRISSAHIPNPGKVNPIIMRDPQNARNETHELGQYHSIDQASLDEDSGLFDERQTTYEFVS